jgi:carboxyl-terminal processing protease
VRPDFEGDQAKLEVSVADIELREIVTEKVLVDLTRGGTGAPTTRQARVTLRDGANVRETPAVEGKTIARVTGGAVSLTGTAVLGEFVRVDLGEGRPGWVAGTDVVTGAAAGGRVEDNLNHLPPRIDMQTPSLVTQAQTLRIQGTSTDESRVRDLYIFVGARKVFYLSNRDAQNPRSLPFDTQIPLQGGINYVTVFVRESPDVVSRRTVVVRRDAPDGALLPTPEHDQDPFGGVEGGDELE